jgi:hypothetical protein
MPISSSPVDEQQDHHPVSLCDLRHAALIPFSLVRLPCGLGVRHVEVCALCESAGNR